MFVRGVRSGYQSSQLLCAQAEVRAVPHLRSGTSLGSHQGPAEENVCRLATQRRRGSLCVKRERDRGKVSKRLACVCLLVSVHARLLHLLACVRVHV